MNPDFLRMIGMEVRTPASTAAGKAIERAQAATVRVSTFLAAAMIANPSVAAVILEQCQVAHMEAAANYAEAARAVREQADAIAAEEMKLRPASSVKDPWL